MAYFVCWQDDPGFIINYGEIDDPNDLVYQYDASNGEHGMITDQLYDRDHYFIDTGAVAPRTAFEGIIWDRTSAPIGVPMTLGTALDLPSDTSAIRTSFSSHYPDLTTDLHPENGTIVCTGITAPATWKVTINNPRYVITTFNLTVTE